MSSESRRLSTLLGHLKATAPPLAAGTATKTSAYRYSLDASCLGCLTAEQRQQYEDSGFIVVKDLVSQHNLGVYRERFKQICMKKVKVCRL